MARDPDKDARDLAAKEALGLNRRGEHKPSGSKPGAGKGVAKTYPNKNQHNTTTKGKGGTGKK
jgi:hypothetical protein